MDLRNIAWRKSSYSTANGGECVELAAAPGVIAVRDSKSPSAGHLSVSVADFGRLIGRIRAGELEL